METVKLNDEPVSTVRDSPAKMIGASNSSRSIVLPSPYKTTAHELPTNHTKWQANRMSSKQMMNLPGWNERRGFARAIPMKNKKLNDYLQQSRSSYVECYRQMIIQKKN